MKLNISDGAYSYPTIFQHIQFFLLDLLILTSLDNKKGKKRMRKKNSPQKEYINFQKNQNKRLHHCFSQNSIISFILVWKKSFILSTNILFHRLENINRCHHQMVVATSNRIKSDYYNLKFNQLTQFLGNISNEFY